MTSALRTCSCRWSRAGISRRRLPGSAWHRKRACPRGGFADLEDTAFYALQEALPADGKVPFTLDGIDDVPPPRSGRRISWYVRSMNAKKIATSLPGSQYAALERVRKRLRLNRSEAVQEAIAIWLAARQGDDRVAQYIRGYADHPDDIREARAMVDAWAEGLTAEDW